MTRRPAVSVIVPFAGSEAQLERLLADLGALAVGESDEVIVADNRGANGMTEVAFVRVVDAAGTRSPGFARNRGAEVARGEWLVFIDADTTPTTSLLDRYFDPPPDHKTGILAGGIHDVADRSGLVARHSVARRHMSQEMTLRRLGSPYAQMANCAVRRSAFDQAGGFAAQVRAGEDADLCFRISRAGWGLEERPDAAVAHRARDTLGALLAQLAKHGSGVAWLNRRHPGEFPPPRPRELAARLGRSTAAAASALARGRVEEAGFALLDLAGACAFELGRLMPNRARRG